MINYFCYKLPQEISRPMYNEYYNRLREIDFIIKNRPAYKLLEDDHKAIKLILCLSVFYKRVIANIAGATVFSGNVFKNSDAVAIKIGDYDLTVKDKNRLLAVIINFQNLIMKYQLSLDLITTIETKDLIRKIKDLKRALETNKKDKSDNDESV